MFIGAPGSETVKTPIPYEKMGKRAQLFEAHELVDVYGQTGSAMQRGLIPSYIDPQTQKPVYPYGAVVPTFVPFAETSALAGQGLIQQGMFQSVRQTFARDIKLPAGFDPQDMPEIGRQWELGREQVIPFRGGAPLQMGRGWAGATLTGRAIEESEGQRIMRMTFERQQTVSDALLKFHTGAFKNIAVEADIEALTGRSDIGAILTPKEYSLLPWNWVQGLSREQYANIVGQIPGTMGGGPVPLKEEELRDWASGGDLAYRAFRQAAPGMQTSITMGGEEIPGLMMNLFLPGRRDYPFSRPRATLPELERMERVAPEVYERVMAESSGIRQDFGAILAAVGATKGEFGVPKDFVSPTYEQFQGVVGRAETAAIEAAGVETVQEVPPGQLVRQYIQSAAQEWGRSAVRVGGLGPEGREGYLAGFGALQRFGAEGIMQGEELTKLHWSSARALKALAMPDAPQRIVGQALQAQEEFASGREFVRGATSAYMPQRAIGTRLAGSQALEPREAYIRPDILMGQYGIRGRGRQERFMQAWEAGQIQPTAMMTGFPITQGVHERALTLLSPGQAAARGMEVSQETPLVTSVDIAQGLQRDFDADQLRALALGSVTFTDEGVRISQSLLPATNEQVLAAAQRAIEAGAGELRAEKGQGPGTLENLLELTDPSSEAWKWRSQEDIQAALAYDLGLKEQIGQTFNIQEQLERGAVGTAGYGAVSRMFDVVHGFRQRPAQPPERLQELSDIIRKGNIWSGGYMRSTVEEDPQGRPVAREVPAQWSTLGVGGITGLAQATIGRAAELVLPGTMPGGSPFGDPRSVASMIAPEENIGAVSAILSRYQQTGGAAPFGELWGAVGQWGGFIRSPLGRTAAPQWYGRQEQFIERGPQRGREEKYRQALEAQQRTMGLPQGVVSQMQSRWAQMQQWRAVRARERSQVPLGETLRALQQVAPEMYEELGMGRPLTAAEQATPARARAAAQETQRVRSAEETFGQAPTTAPSYAQEYAERYSEPAGPVDLNEIYGAGYETAAALPTIARGGAIGGGTVPPLSGGTTAGTGGRGRVPPGTGRPGAAPTGGDFGSGRAGDGDDSRGESLTRFIERMFGVSRGKFQEAVTGMAGTLEEWNRSVRPLIESSEELDKNQRTATYQLSQYANTIQRALRMGGEEAWPGMGPTVERAGLLRETPGFAELGGAMGTIRNQELQQMLGMAGGGGLWGRIQQGLGRGLTGWGAMQIRRLWGITGGAAMRQIPAAAQQQQAFIGAAMAGMPLAEYQPSGMALDLMAYRAGRQDFGAAVGRGAYGAWGWTQRAAGEGLGETLGAAGPALGAGLVSSLAASWMGGAGLSFGAALGSVGIPVAAIAGVVGAGAYTANAMQDRERMAIGQARGPWGRGFAGFRDWALGRVSQMGPTGRQRLQFEGARQGPGLQEYGQQLLGGDLTGLSMEGRTAAIQEAARTATERGGPLYGFSQEQAAQMAGQFMGYGWGGENIGDVFADPLLAQMTQLGMAPGDIAGLAGQFGLAPTTGGRQVMEVLQGLPSGAARANFRYSAPYYGALGRFGMTPELAQQLPMIENPMQRQFMQRLNAGSQLAWSQFGLQTGQDWAVTQDPTTGMGIGTNWGGQILGQRMGQVGTAGQEVNVQGGQITFNVTGQQVEFSQWDIQDYQRQQQEGFQDWQYGFRVQGLDLSLRRQQELWGFEDVGRDLSRARQWEQFGFQREGAAMSDRQFRERWNVNWQQLGITSEWQQEDRARQWGRAQAQFGWQREDLAFRGAQTSLQFGWQMEDIEENMRFATGRQRRRLRQQQERAAISYGMGMGQLETQGQRIDTREQWAREDFERAQERHEQTTQWRRREMQLQLRHHNERIGLQQRRQNAAEQYFRSTTAHQDRQSTAARRYWTETHNRQRQAIEMERRYYLTIREVQTAQLALSRAQQLQMNQFRAEWESGGAVRRSFSSFFAWLELQIQRLRIIDLPSIPY
jgi:hypothetical protein